jgi:hypothetical protein
MCINWIFGFDGFHEFMQEGWPIAGNRPFSGISGVWTKQNESLFVR